MRGKGEGRRKESPTCRTVEAARNELTCVTSWNALLGRSGRRCKYDSVGVGDGIRRKPRTLASAASRAPPSIRHKNGRESTFKQAQ